MFATVHKTLAAAGGEFEIRIFGANGLAQAVRAALRATGRESKRLRVINAVLMLYLVLMLSVYRDSSIPNVFKKLVSLLREGAAGLLCAGVWLPLSLKVVSDEAILKARDRLGWTPLEHLFNERASLVRPAPSFCGLRVWGVDGVRFSVPDTKENLVGFGRPASGRAPGAFPQMSAVMLVDTVNHRIRASVFRRGSESERISVPELVDLLNGEDLVLFDRGFAGFPLYYQCEQSNVKFVCRVPRGHKPRIIKVLGQGDYLVEVVGSIPLAIENQASTTKSLAVNLILRMIVYQCGNNNEVCRLLTNLRSATDYPAQACAELYHERWECEVVYDELKTHLVTVHKGTLALPFRSKTPARVIQEAYGMLVAYNLIRDLMIESGRQFDIPPVRISFVGTLGVIDLAIRDIQQAACAKDVVELTCQLLKDIADCELKRPRRKRSCKRVVKQKMSNYAKKQVGDKSVKTDNRVTLLDSP